MKIFKPLWAEGVLLSPQHFQQQNQWIDLSRQMITELNGPYLWGVKRLVWDEGVLEIAKLKADEIQVVFPDGSLVDTVRADLLPNAQNLKDVPEHISSFLVLLGLPLLRSDGRNCRGEGDETTQARRYFSEYAQVSDLFSDNAEEVLVARQSLSLIFDFDPHEDFLTCPLARLIRDSSGVFRLDPNYIPPSLFLSSHPALIELIDRLSGILLVRSAALAARRSERNRDVADFSVSDVTLMWLLNCIHQSWPELAHLKSHPQTHPEKAYLALARLLGTLTVFSTAVGLEEIPAYNHLNLQAVMGQLEVMIRDLLDTVIPSQVIVVNLEHFKASQWRAGLHDPRLFEEDVDFYLAARADLPAYQLQDRLPMVCKVGSQEEVDHIINSAVTGIPLKPLQRVPSAIPVRLENQYFALEKSNKSFAAMLAARQITIYVPAAVTNVTLELFAVRRSQ